MEYYYKVQWGHQQEFQQTGKEIEAQETLLYTGEVHRHLVRQFLLRRDHLQLHPFIHHSPWPSQLPFMAHGADARKRESSMMFRARPGPAMGIHPRIRD